MANISITGITGKNAIIHENQSQSLCESFWYIPGRAEILRLRKAVRIVPHKERSLITVSQIGSFAASEINRYLFAVPMICISACPTTTADLYNSFQIRTYSSNRLSCVK